MAIGAIQRRQGKWTESTANLEKAAALDPKNASILINLAYNYMALRNFEAADKTVDRAIAVAPQSFGDGCIESIPGDLYGKAISPWPKNNFLRFQPTVDPNGLVTWARCWVLMLQRKFPEALAVVQKFPGETLIVDTSSARARRLSWKERFICSKAIRRRRRSAFEHARVVSEQLLREAPEDPRRHAQHGLILAALGRKEEAIAEGKRAVELLPESQDAFDGPRSHRCARTNLCLDWRI